MQQIKLVAFVILFFLPVYGFTGNYLTDNQIRAAFSNKTTEWTHMSKNLTGKTFTASDGTLIGVSGDKKRHGKWYVSGNMLCLSWGHCTPIEADGKGGYFQVAGKGKRVIHINKVADGNTL